GCRSGRRTACPLARPCRAPCRRARPAYRRRTSDRRRAPRTIRFAPRSRPPPWSTAGQAGHVARAAFRGELPACLGLAVVAAGDVAGDRLGLAFGRIAEAAAARRRHPHDVARADADVLVL